jgi:hypothetical protein
MSRPDFPLRLICSLVFTTIKQNKKKKIFFLKERDSPSLGANDKKMMNISSLELSILKYSAYATKMYILS